MAWLIRQESGGYVLAEQHPIVQNGALYFSESDTVGVTPPRRQPYCFTAQRSNRVSG